MKRRRHHASLRGRLLRMLLLPILGGILLVGAASYFSTYHEAAEIYDAEQVHFAKVLHTLARQVDKGSRVAIEGFPRYNAYEKYLAFRVWKEGVLFLQSDNVDAFGPMTQNEGFTDRMIGTVRWRFYKETQGDYIVEVAEEYEVRLDLVRHILGGIFFPQLIIFPVIAIIIGVGVTRGLQPVETLSQRVRRRSLHQLKPISTGLTPKELLPMVDAINDLMRRVDDAMRIEKHFTNYAAHEMRTPIAALKTQAQVMLRTKDTGKQKELAAALLETIDRTQRIIEQLLTYARVQHHDAVLTTQDISPLVLDELRNLAPRVVEKQLTLTHEIPACVMACVHADLLRLIITNLLDNAVKYTPAHGTIAVTLRQQDGIVMLTVQDDGPGLTAEQQQHMFDPFYRVAGNSATGAGLGLAIVKWACDTQQIHIHTHAGINGRGLSIQLSLAGAIIT